MWTSLPNLWAFSPVSRIEIGSGILLETSFNNNSVFLSFSIINNVLLLLYLYFMFRFFNGYCIFSGQPFPAGFDLIFISGCACSKLSAVVEIKPLHIICRNVLYILIHHSHTPDGLSALPVTVLVFKPLMLKLFCWSGVTCTYSSYVCVGVYCVTIRIKNWGERTQTAEFMFLTSKLPVQ